MVYTSDHLAHGLPTQNRFCPVCDAEVIYWIPAVIYNPSGDDEWVCATCWNYGILKVRNRRVLFVVQGQRTPPIASKSSASKTIKKSSGKKSL